MIYLLFMFGATGRGDYMRTAPPPPPPPKTKT